MYALNKKTLWLAALYREQARASFCLTRTKVLFFFIGNSRLRKFFSNKFSFPESLSPWPLFCKLKFAKWCFSASYRLSLHSCLWMIQKPASFHKFPAYINEKPASFASKVTSIKNEPDEDRFWYSLLLTIPISDFLLYPSHTCLSVSYSVCSCEGCEGGVLLA